MGIVSFIIVEVQYVLNFHFVVCSVSFSAILHQKNTKTHRVIIYLVFSLSLVPSFIKHLLHFNLFFFLCLLDEGNPSNQTVFMCRN